MIAEQGNGNEINGIGFYDLLKKQFEAELKSCGCSASEATELCALLADKEVTSKAILQLLVVNDE